MTQMQVKSLSVGTRIVWYDMIRTVRDVTNCSRMNGAPGLMVHTDSGRFIVAPETLIELAGE